MDMRLKYLDHPESILLVCRRQNKTFVLASMNPILLSSHDHDGGYGMDHYFLVWGGYSNLIRTWSWP